MKNTQEQVTQCHRHDKDFKQWWSTAKYTLKCDEGDAMEIWLASQTNQGEMLKALTKDYNELTEMYIQQGINFYKQQKLVALALDFAKDALEFAEEDHSDLNIAMLKMAYILKGENDEEVD